MKCYRVLRECHYGTGAACDLCRGRKEGKILRVQQENLNEEQAKRIAGMYKDFNPAIEEMDINQAIELEPLDKVWAACKEVVDGIYSENGAACTIKKTSKGGKSGFRFTQNIVFLGETLEVQVKTV